MTKLLFLIFIFYIIVCSFVFGQIGNSCTLKTTGISGTCKLASDCPQVSEQAKSGIPPTSCGLQLNEPIVCCENNIYSLTPNDNLFLNNEQNGDFVYPENNNEPIQFENKYNSISEQKCQEYSRAVTGTVQAITLATQSQVVTIPTVKCDYNGIALIVGGKPASLGEFPFMAAIGFKIDNNIEWKCGGTLISEDYVLTAAHCKFSRDNVLPSVVRLGDLDLTKTDDAVHIDINIKNITTHPDYKSPQKYNDIALIQLSEKVKFTKYIRPACLYTKTSIQQPQAVATGWGKTDYLASEINSKLMKVSLNLYENQFCTETYPPSKHLPQGIRSSMICAGEIKGGMDTCQGDSGGPLLVTKKGNQCKFFVIGVTSFGKFCGQENTPAIYTRVSSYVSWIEKIIW